MSEFVKETGSFRRMYMLVCLFSDLSIIFIMILIIIIIILVNNNYFLYFRKKYFM